MRATIVYLFGDVGYGLIALNDGTPRLVPLGQLRLVRSGETPRPKGALYVVGDRVIWSMEAHW